MLDLAGRESIYQPEQTGLIFPERVTFDTVEEERLYRKQRLVAACRAFAQQKFDYGFAGHLTVRDPETPDLYWTNPMCVHFDKVCLSNLILVQLGLLTGDMIWVVSKYCLVIALNLLV